jgi:hypothetical protein
MIELWTVLNMCIMGNYICERDNSPPPMEYYKKGEACYINGEFYQSCPSLVQESKERKRKPWD